MLAFALDAAQDGVDEAFGADLAVMRGEVDGFVDNAVVAEVHGKQLAEAEVEDDGKRMAGARRWFGHHLRAEVAIGTVLAQGAIDQSLVEGLVGGCGMAFVLGDEGVEGAVLVDDAVDGGVGGLAGFHVRVFPLRLRP